MHTGALQVTLHAGEWVKCKVLSVEPTRGRVALSLKQMQADPLDQSLQSVLPTGDEEVRSPDVLLCLEVDYILAAMLHRRSASLDCTCRA